MEKRSSNIIFLVIISLFVIFAFTSFIPRACFNQNPTIPFVDDKQIEPFEIFLSSSSYPPDDYITRSFNQYDIIFLGQFYNLKQQVSFVTNIIPKLYESGITQLGIEYALHQDQDEIDALLTASTFSQEKAEQILFHYSIFWGYSEYIELFKAAWALNNSLSEGTFRIIGLSPKKHYEYIQTEEDNKDKEIIKKIYSEGRDDVYMAEVIKEEIIEKGLKALILCNMQYAFTRYIDKQYVERMKELGFDDIKSPGNIIYQLIGDKTATVLLHSPWPNQQGQFSYPVEGMIDAVLQHMPEEYYKTGFDVTEDAFGMLPVKTSIYSYEYDELFLKDICNGYILLGKISSYEPCTLIPEFINLDNLEEAILNYPGPKDSELDLEKLNQYMEYYTTSVINLINIFKQ